MPYVSRELLRLSLEQLRKKYSPLLMVSVPCMLSKKVPTCATAAEASSKAIAFGGRDERRWLDRYFKVPGGPPGKPYFMPSTGEWVEERYAETSLQRRRTDFDDSVFFHPDMARWAFTKNAASALKTRVLKSIPKIPIVALMAWMWREREIASLPRAVDDFINEFGFDRDKLLIEVYEKTIPQDFTNAGLGSTAVSAADVAELIGATPPPPASPDLADAITGLETAIKDAHFISPPGLVQRIVGGWLVGDIVVLVGPTGSGKTALSRALAKGLENLFGERFLYSFLEVAPDFDAAQFLGYENLAGEFTAGRFANEVLFVGAISDPRLVVLDEWNLAQIDTYFAPILSVIESGQVLRIPGRLTLSALDEDTRAMLLRAQPSIATGQVAVPDNCFFIATCNSWTEEPETRLQISGPVKRRCRIIPMPNALVTKYREAKQDGIIETCNTLLDQERAAVSDRQSSGRVSVWDKHRESRLAAIANFAALPGVTRGKLLQLCKVLLENPLTQDGFTPGILRDVLLSCVYAEAGQDLAALGEQVADKVLHQVHGEPKILEVIVDITKDLPNADEISQLARRMGAFAGERRIRPLI